jgi:hypothetical protein
MTGLLWVSHLYGSIGSRFQARTADGVYDIMPCLERRKGRYQFLGYDVRYVALRSDDPETGDDPDLVEDEDIRIIKSGVQTVVEAKALAQADADG